MSGPGDDFAHGNVASIRCSLCGEWFLPDDVITVEKAVTCGRCKPQLVQMLQEGVPAGASEADVDTALFIGPGALYYQACFANLEERALRVSWNWPALLAGIGWLLYRKMYLLAGIVVAFTAAQFLAEELFAVHEGVSLSFDAVLTLLLGVYGNWAYRRHVQGKLRRLAACDLSPSERRSRLIKTGGVNLWLGVGGFLIFIGAIFAADWLLDPEAW